MITCVSHSNRCAATSLDRVQIRPDDPSSPGRPKAQVTTDDNNSSAFGIEKKEKISSKSRFTEAANSTVITRVRPRGPKRNLETYDTDRQFVKNRQILLLQYLFVVSLTFFDQTELFIIFFFFVLNTIHYRLFDQKTEYYRDSFYKP